MILWTVAYCFNGYFCQVRPPCWAGVQGGERALGLRRKFQVFREILGFIIQILFFLKFKFEVYFWSVFKVYLKCILRVYEVYLKYSNFFEHSLSVPQVILKCTSEVYLKYAWNVQEVYLKHFCSITWSIQTI